MSDAPPIKIYRRALARFPLLGIGRTPAKGSAWRCLPWLALLLLLSGCGPNPNRAPCIRNCAQQKDACMLEATNASEVQSCDTHEMSCSSICPN